MCDWAIAFKSHPILAHDVPITFALSQITSFVHFTICVTLVWVHLDSALYDKLLTMGNEIAIKKLELPGPAMTICRETPVQGK